MSMTEISLKSSDSIDIHPALALDAADIGVWEWNPANGVMSCDLRMRSLFGLPAEATFESFLASVHPEDRSRTRAVLRDASHDERHHRCECRSMLSTAAVERWVDMAGRAYVLDSATRHVLGIATDISARKQADLRRELLSQDMEHRMTNMFSVVAAIVSLSQRTAETPEQLATGLRTRLGALAHAHDLLRNAAPGAMVQLQRVIEAQLAPFADSSRVTVWGPPTQLGRSQAMALNMIAHELTTNAVKHGALSSDGGQVAIRWSIQSSPAGERLLLSWKETCRSRIMVPTRAGLGSKLLSTSARHSLGGDIFFDYQRDGLLATLVVPTARLATPAGN
jgi:two-component sensor histidine kinase